MPTLLSCLLLTLHRSAQMPWTWAPLWHSQCPGQGEGGCSQGLEYNPNQWADFRRKFCTTAWERDHSSEEVW